jgi:N-glycosylase/DNA lyase
MGYRAKYLMETIKTLTELGGEKYLQDLRNINDPIAVQEKLIKFCGVGRKVADCIALFSLNCHDAVPVDVHVWNIARRDYGADALIQASKSLTPTIYQQIGGLFRSRFPTRAGWAHSLLFVAELPSFRGVLPPDLVEEMDQVRTTQAHLTDVSVLDDQPLTPFHFGH